MTEHGERVGLDAFVAALPEADAAAVRAAAAQIDALEREVGPPGWIERNLIPLAGFTFAMLVVGVVALVSNAGGLRDTLGPGGLTLLLAAFPALIFAYLLAVRERTRLDKEKMALNETHFLPRGGIYFGSRGGTGEVVRISRPVKPQPDLRIPTLRDEIEATYRAVTRNPRK